MDIILENAAHDYNQGREKCTFTFRLTGHGGFMHVCLVLAMITEFQHSFKELLVFEELSSYKEAVWIGALQEAIYRRKLGNLVPTV